MTPFDFILYALGFIFVGGVFGFGAGIFWTLRSVYAARSWDMDSLGQEESRCQ